MLHVQLASMFFQILLQDNGHLSYGQSLLNAYQQWTYDIIIICYWKLINCEVRIENMHYVVYMQKVAHFPPKSKKFSIIILQKITKNAKVSLTSNYVLMVNLGMGNKIKNNYCLKM